jgi:hypothetical protein
MARMKFSELAKQTMTPESIARSRKAANKEISAMGGNLIIIADFKDRKVELSHIGKPGDSRVRKVRRHKTPAPK